MKERFDKQQNFNVIEFESLNELTKYLRDTKINKAFENKPLSSTDKNYRFRGTHTFEEALDLLHNGWKEQADNLANEIKFKDKMVKNKNKSFYDIQGYQVSVPRYLEGIPESMINSKKIAIKNKIITINKGACYNSGTSKEQMIDESIKIMKLINDLESKGYRVNLNLIYDFVEDSNNYTNKNNTNFLVKIKIKNSNERLNISKLAFPLVHPSMLRRIIFRFMEVYPKVTPSFTWGYGRTLKDYQLKDIIENSQLNSKSTINYYAPAFVPNNFTIID